MNRRNDGSWAVILISAFSLFILMLPIWNSGVCISEGSAVESVGVCARQWLQAIGPVIIGLIAIYPTYLSYLHAKKEKEKDREIEKKATLSAEIILLSNINDYYDSILNSIKSSIGVFKEHGKGEIASSIANSAIKNIRSEIYNSDEIISKLNDKTMILSYDMFIHGRQFFEYNIKSLKYRTELAISVIETGEKTPVDAYTELSKDLIITITSARDSLSKIEKYISLISG